MGFPVQIATFKTQSKDLPTTGENASIKFQRHKTHSFERELIDTHLTKHNINTSTHDAKS